MCTFVRPHLSCVTDSHTATKDLLTTQETLAPFLLPPHKLAQSKLLLFYFQAVGMFIGEFSCWIVFQIYYFYLKKKDRTEEAGNQQFTPFLFLPPAICDMTATSLMYIIF